MRAHDARPLTADTLTVYPTALKAESVLRERARAEGCLLGHRVTTFPQLTDALARDLGLRAAVLEPEMAAVVLAGALDRPGVPEPLRGSRRGLLHELLAVIGELKAAHLDPPDVAAVAAGLPRGAAAERLADLGRVYAAYESELGRLGAVDRHGRDRSVCDALARAEATGSRPRTLAGIGRVVFAEIYDFSVLQFLIATALIRLVGDAELVAFAHPENVDATRFLERTWNRFVADPGIADQVLPSFVVRGGRTGSLAAALRGVFTRERPAPAAGDGSITLTVAPSRYREVEAAGRDIRRRLERGEPPERIALLSRDLARYGDLIEDVCRRFRIPVFFRKGQPLLANGLVKTVVNVVRCVADGFPRHRLEALLETDYLRATEARLARALRSTGFVAETARPLRDCLAHAASSDRRRASLAVDGPRLLATMDVLRGLEGVRPVAAHVAALGATLERLGLRAVRNADLAAAAARRDVRARTRLDETLAALAALTQAMGGGPVTLADFVGHLLAALETQEVEDAADASGSVRALSVLDARGLDFDTVYLLGLDDGSFPAPRSESPLLPDAFRRAANPVAAGVLRRKLGARADGLPLGGLLRTAREASLEDPFLFFLALSMAEQRLVLSYPATDERGNPTVASPFVEEVAACLAGGLEADVLPPTAVVPAAADCCELGELVQRAALDRWAGAAPDRLTAALRAADPAGAGRLAAIDRRATIEERRSRYFLLPRGEEARKETLADAWVGRLGGDPASLRARLAAMTWSPTRLGALGRCGFKFFAGYLVGLKPERDPELEVLPFERGTLFHRMLEEFLRAHPTLPEGIEAARALGRRFLSGRDGLGATAIPPKDPAFLGVAWTQLEAALDQLIRYEHAEQERRRAAGLDVERWLEHELAFTLDDPDGGAPLALAGTPDRVEVERHDGRAQTLRVLDYKATRYRAGYPAHLDPEKELGRTAFQIPVYLLAALASGIAGVDAETVLEGGYLLLLAPPWEDPVVAELSREVLGADPVPGSASVVARIRALVAAGRAGRFDVNPSPCDPRCEFRTVCRYQPPPLEEEGGDA